LYLSLESLMTRLERSLQQLIDPKVLNLGEIGDLPLSQLEASLFFRLVGCVSF
jgi:hypothetical protein